MSDADRTPDEATLAHHRVGTGGPPENPVKRVTIRVTGLRGGTMPTGTTAMVTGGSGATGATGATGSANPRWR